MASVQQRFVPGCESRERTLQSRKKSPVIPREQAMTTHCFHQPTACVALDAGTFDYHEEM